MYTERTTESDTYRNMNPSVSLTPRLLKVTPKHNKFHQKTLSTLDNSAATAIQTRSTENDETDRRFDPLSFNTSPIPCLKLPIDTQYKEYLGKEFNGDYSSNPKPIRSLSKRSSSNAHIDTITSKNDRNFLNYLSYLDNCDKISDDTWEFRRQLLKKGESLRKLDELKSSKIEEQTDAPILFYSPQFIKAMEQTAQKLEKTTSICSPEIPQKNSKSKSITLKLPLVTRDPSRSVSISEKSQTSRGKLPPQLDTKTLRSLEMQYRSLVEEVLINYEEFLIQSARHHLSYYYIKDYLKNKPDFCDIFLSKYNNQFRELPQVRKILLEQMVTTPSIIKSGVLASHTTSLAKTSTFSKDPNAQTKTISEIKPKLDKTLLMRLNLFNQELFKINVERQLKDLEIVSDTMIKKHSDDKKKYDELMKKLYHSNRKQYHKIKNLMDAVKRDYPTISTGIMTRIEECEKRCGEIPEIRSRTRTLGHCLDDAMAKWTKTIYSQEELVESAINSPI